MRGIGPGVMEIRVHCPGEFRVLYVAKFAEAIYVLHAFAKKSQKTAKSDLDLAQRRYAQMTAIRRSIAE
jgi:phage-related protein